MNPQIIKGKVLVEKYDPRNQYVHFVLFNLCQSQGSNSDGHTVILVATDCFSRALRLIRLPGLPSSFELAEIMFNQVFRYFGLPENIVSDREPSSHPRYGITF